MTAKAIITMIVVLGLVWGGLILAIIRLQKMKVANS
jgi:hypothetical protein